MSSGGYQFVHIEAYGAKARAGRPCVGFVLAEAARRPEACTHVAAPRPPELVFGSSPAEVATMHAVRHAAARTSLQDGRRRAIRSDQLTLLTVIASHPATMDEVQTCPDSAAAVADWERHVVGWAQQAWGADLVSVVRHTDEAHAHLHCLVLPSDPEMRAARLHPGKTAKEAAVTAALQAGQTEKAANALGNAAYKGAMRSFQDNFWYAVGLPCGLTRVGPGRQRLSRAAWQAKRAETQATAQALRLRESARAEVEAAHADARRIRAAAQAEQRRAEQARVDAEKETARGEQMMMMAARASMLQAKKQAQQLTATEAGVLDRAREEAARIVAAAKVEARHTREAHRTLGSRVGSVLHGLRGAAPAAVARAAEARAREEERVAGQSHRASLQQEIRRLGSQVSRLERDLRASTVSVAELGHERDQARMALGEAQDTIAAFTMAGYRTLDGSCVFDPIS